MFCLVFTAAEFVLLFVSVPRYVATAVTSVHEMENGFNIWSFNGKLLYRVLKDHFFQVTYPLYYANHMFLIIRKKD